MSKKEIEEAIEKLKEDTQHPTSQYMPELLRAEQLGIEALEQIIQCRKVPFLQTCMNKLPSETIEQE